MRGALSEEEAEEEKVSSSRTAASAGASPNSFRKNKCSTHLRPTERKAGKRKSNLAKRASSATCCALQCCSNAVYTRSRARSTSATRITPRASAKYIRSNTQLLELNFQLRTKVIIKQLEQMENLLNLIHNTSNIQRLSMPFLLKCCFRITILLHFQVRLTSLRHKAHSTSELFQAGRKQMYVKKVGQTSYILSICKNKHSSSYPSALRSMMTAALSAAMALIHALRAIAKRNEMQKVSTMFSERTR